MVTRGLGKRNVMIDLETLGTTPGSVIFAIGAVRFDSKGIAEHFYRLISINDGLRHGFHTDPMTLAWWLGRTIEERGEYNKAFKLEPVYGEVVDLYEALRDFMDFVEAVPESLVWGNGATMDLSLLSAAYRMLNLPTPWHYRNERCARTMLALFGQHVGYIDPKDAQYTHHAAEDARYEAIEVSRILAYLEAQNVTRTV
jgi:hypothetical protein